MLPLHVAHAKTRHGMQIGVVISQVGFPKIQNHFEESLYGRFYSDEGLEASAVLTVFAGPWSCFAD